MNCYFVEDQEKRGNKKRRKEARDMHAFSWELGEPKFFPRRGSCMILSLINEAAAVIYFHNELAVPHIDRTLFTSKTGRGRDYFYEDLQYKVMFSRLLYKYMGGIKQKSQVSLIRKVQHWRPSQIVYIYSFFSLGGRKQGEEPRSTEEHRGT
jgi:hypothetical protein